MTCRVCRALLFFEERQRGTCLACALTGERRAQTLMYFGSLNRVAYVLIEWRKQMRRLELA